MLVQRLRRWTNIKPAQAQWLVSAVERDVFCYQTAAHVACPVGHEYGRRARRILSRHAADNNKPEAGMSNCNRIPLFTTIYDLLQLNCHICRLADMTV